jgi:uncharacterized membrane protein
MNWNNFWDVIWFFFWIFAYTVYLFALFGIIIDLFRDRQLNGWWKALWVIFLIFVPFLTALVYLIARGRGMAERRAGEYVAVKEDDDYTGSAPLANPAHEIEKAKNLLDQGVISQGEFDAIKNKALGNKF